MLKRPQNICQRSEPALVPRLASSTQKKSAMPSFLPRPSAPHTRSSHPTNQPQSNFPSRIPIKTQGSSLSSAIRVKAVAAVTDAVKLSANTVSKAPARTRPAVLSISSSPWSPSSKSPSVPNKKRASSHMVLDLQLTETKSSLKRHPIMSNASKTSLSQASSNTRRSFNPSLIPTPTAMTLAKPQLSGPASLTSAHSRVTVQEAAAAINVKASVDKSRTQTSSVPEWPENPIYDGSFDQPTIPFECDFSAILAPPLCSGRGKSKSSLRSCHFADCVMEDYSEDEYTGLAPGDLARMKSIAQTLELATRHHGTHWRMLQRRHEQRHQHQVEMRQQQQQQQQLHKYQHQIQQKHEAVVGNEADVDENRSTQGSESVSPTSSKNSLTQIIPMLEESLKRLSLIRREISELKNEVEKQNMRLTPRCLCNGRNIEGSTVVSGAKVFNNESKGSKNGQGARAKRQVCVFLT